MSLKGKVALVTGGSRGIGRAVCLELARQGADVAVNYAGNEAAAQETAQACRELGVRAVVLRADVADAAACDAMVAQVLEQLGRLDILVNNAGVNSRIPFLELTEEEWHRMMGINLDGVFYCCKAVLPYMAERQSGTIINISSTASKTAHAHASICYGASKAAVNSMTQKLAYEMGPYHIRVNGICPGPIETDMSLQWTKEYRTNVVKKIPLGVLGTTKNVADVAVFLASDMAGFINGETINVNGGSYMN